MSADKFQKVEIRNDNVMKSVYTKDDKFEQPNIIKK